MNNKNKIIFAGLAVLLISSGCRQETLEIAISDPMVKVFPDTFNRNDDTLLLRFKCAANEYEPAQFILRSNVDLEGVTVEIGDLENSDGHVITGLTWNFVGFIPLETNTPDTGRISSCGTHAHVPAGRELIRLAPCEIPDPLLEERKIDLQAGRSQPVWVTVYVPPATPPGIYTGQARVLNPLGEQQIPIELEVYPFELPDERNMYLTNWFTHGHIARAHDLELFSEEFWDMLARYAKNLADHRQNVAYTPWQIIQIFREGGIWNFDYSNFDRFVETFIEAGVIGRIEIRHIGAPSRGEYVGMGLYDLTVIDLSAGDTLRVPGEEGMPYLLADLQRHLAAKGWLEKTLIHVSDEPNYYTIGEWKKIARWVKQYAPDIKTIDAISATGFEGLLDVGVPLISKLQTEPQTYRGFQEEPGSELWFYTACVPYGHYPNRFLDYPLTDMRIMHWLNYMFDIEGYLHWGLTYWGSDPFGPQRNFPPGDSHIIYPGNEGPLNSIRWEIQRESIEDFEYFRLLETRTDEVKKILGPAADRVPSDFRSKEIGGMVVKSLAEYVMDPEAISRARDLLAFEISNIDQSPLILFRTYPDVNTPVFIGPARVTIFGVAEDHAEVVVNGRQVEILPDGSFVAVANVESENNRTVRIEVEKNGQTKIIEREFEVR